MADTEETFQRYRVVYSEEAKETLREFGRRARAQGASAAYRTAVQHLDEVLQIYPQLGEPLFDLKAELGQILLASLDPFYVRYAVY